MRRIATVLLTLIPLALCAQDDAAEPENLDATPTFVFEGDVDYVDPVLRADIGPPRVLSGTMETAKFPELELEEGLPNLLPTMSILDAEFTLDRNYVISYEGHLSLPNPDHLLVGYIYIKNGEDKEEADKISFTANMAGDALNSGYKISFLSILLVDEKGGMVDSTEPFTTAPPYKQATFELTFINPDTGETAKATGEITMFANLDADVTPQEDYQQLEKQILELDTLLQAKEAEAAELQKLLEAQSAELKRRDAIIAEFQANQKKLIAENEQLRSGEELQRMQEVNADLLAQLEDTQDARGFSAASVAQISVRQERLAKDNADLAQSNADLRQQLADAYADLSALRGQQELLSRQAERQFEYDLPPLPPTAESKHSNLPLATETPKAAVTAAPPSPPAPTSLQAMAVAAVQEAGSSRDPSRMVEVIDVKRQELPEKQPDASPKPNKIPPGQLTNARESTATPPPQSGNGSWRFELPVVAEIKEVKPKAVAPTAPPEIEEESSSHIERRGPRR